MLVVLSCIGCLWMAGVCEKQGQIKALSFSHIASTVNSLNFKHFTNFCSSTEQFVADLERHMAKVQLL